MLRVLLTILLRLHRDRRGAEGLEKLLIVAAIVLPLLALLIVFRNDLTQWVTDKWTVVQNSAMDGPPP